jgi:hypothetical protein
LCLTFGISIAKAYAKSIEGLLVDVPSKGPCSTAKFNNMDMLVKVYVSLTSAPFSFYLTKAKTNTKSSEVESKLPLLTPRFSARSSLRLSGVYQAASFALFLFLRPPPPPSPRAHFFSSFSSPPVSFVKIRHEIWPRSGSAKEEKLTSAPRGVAAPKILPSDFL